MWLIFLNCLRLSHVFSRALFTPDFIFGRKNNQQNARFPKSREHQHTKWLRAFLVWHWIFEWKNRKHFKGNERARQKCKCRSYHVISNVRVALRMYSVWNLVGFKKTMNNLRSKREVIFDHYHLNITAWTRAIISCTHTQQMHCITNLWQAIYQTTTTKLYFRSVWTFNELIMMYSEIHKPKQNPKRREIEAGNWFSAVSKWNVCAARATHPRKCYGSDFHLLLFCLGCVFFGLT